MATTKEVTLNGETFTLRRPTLKEFAQIGYKYRFLNDLLGRGILDSSQKVSELRNKTPMQAFMDMLYDALADGEDKEKFKTALESADYGEGVTLWDEYGKLCEFESFFANRQQQEFARSKNEQVSQLDLIATAIQTFKTKELLPKDFMLTDILSGKANGANLTNLLSTLTSTQASMDGLEQI